MLSNPQDYLHKSQIMQVLMAIADNDILSTKLYFKGGTCAAMLGHLDRFSVDIDFDVDDEGEKQIIRKEFVRVFHKLNMRIVEENPKVLQFTVKYKAPTNHKNSLKIDALGQKYKNNRYEQYFFPEINRTMNCQTIETMFANKLVAVSERYEKHKTVAGRDIYDIHYLLLTGKRYLSEIIIERTGKTPREYLTWLRVFIFEKVTMEVLIEDLGPLANVKKMGFIKNNLKLEVLSFLDNEIAHLS